MARLPTFIDVGAPRGARPSGDTVRPTDFGLGELGQAVGEVGQAIEIRADRDAEKIMRAATPSFEQQFGERAANYDGKEPGFANQALASLDNHFTAVSEDPTYSAPVRAALRKRVDAYRADLGQRAIGTETRARAGVIAEQRAVKDEARLGGLEIGFNTAFSEGYQARVDAYDGSDPAFATGVLADFDASAKAAIEAAPETDRTGLEARLAARRVRIHAGALETQDKAHGAFVAQNARGAVSTLANTVVSNPAAYESTRANIDTAAAGVPAGLRPAFIKGANAELAAARIEGLILKGDTEAAKAELADGRYDQLLDPGQKSALIARANGADHAGPQTQDDFRKAYEADAAIDGEEQARLRGKTTGLTLQGIVEQFGLTPREAAATEQRLKRADEVSAAMGPLRGQTSQALHDRATAPEPDPAAPDYAGKLHAWELSRKAAAQELTQREKDSAAWAMVSERQGDAGDVIQQAYKGFLEAPDVASQKAGAQSYVGYTLGLQQQAGVAPVAQRVFSKDQAAELERAYAGATPETKGKALRALAGVWSALPTQLKMQDGRMVSPRGMAARELKQAGLVAADLSALADLSDTPGKLELYAEATANPAALQPLAGTGRESELRSLIDTRLEKFFATANALPGSAEQNIGRAARARITARQLVLVKGMTPRDAAEAATADLVDEYRFIDGWRVPAAVAAAPQGMLGNRGMAIRRGAALALGDLIGDGGVRLAPAPGSAGMSIEGRRQSAAQTVRDSGRWVTSEDDGGLQLMLPTTRGWTAAADSAGRAVRLTWGQLSAIGAAGAGRRPGDWLAPPPSAAMPTQAPPAKARAAFTAAIEHRESGGQTNAVSPKGAAGLRQLMPATARWQANMDGDKVFAGKSDAQVQALLLSDPALNRRISDRHIEYLSTKYAGNVGLMAAAYNAGPGAVDGWLKSIGDPRRGRISLDEWVAAIPFGETRAYVRDVLPRAMKNLGHG